MISERRSSVPELSVSTQDCTTPIAILVLLASIGEYTKELEG